MADSREEGLLKFDWVNETMENIEVIEKIGKNPGKNVVIMAGVHGDEVCGVKAFDELVSEISVDNGKITFIYANLEAQKLNKRYVEFNLNRCFLDEQPEKMANSLEGKTAKAIIPYLRDADALLDLHSSKTSDSLKYLICENDSLDIISFLAPERVILGIGAVQQGGSDGYMYGLGKPGICIECGLHEGEESVNVAKEAILSFLVGTENIESENVEKVAKKLFRSAYFYKCKNGPFKLERDFKDFEKMDEKTLVGYDGDEKIYLENDDVIMFALDGGNVGDECFMVLREETLLKDGGLDKSGGENEN